MRELFLWIMGAMCWVGLAAGQASTPQHQRWQTAVRAPEVERMQARVVVLDVATGRLLASARLPEAAQTLATPGSTLKPMILFHALRAGRWDSERRIACSRDLHSAGHALNCSHPPAEPMDAREALTWSCNSYFASLAGSLGPEELKRTLEQSGLLAATGLAPGESVAQFRTPRTPDQTRLAALGVEGVRVTLLELAEAYRRLELEMERSPSLAAQVVSSGLQDSASFGIAGAAALGAVSVAGKTGTAESEPGLPTHGWFIGLAPAQKPQLVIAVYVPAGHGADAAAVAGAVLANSPLRSR